MEDVEIKVKWIGLRSRLLQNN